MGSSSMEGLSVLPATRSVELSENALFLVLCCDGVTDVMTDQQILTVIHEGYTKLRKRAQKEQQQQQQQQQQEQEGQQDGEERMMRGVAGKLARWLVHTALKRGSRDNCSAIVLLL